MKTRVLALVAAVLCLSACLFALVGCSSDKGDLVGEWRVQNTNVTVVFSDTKFKVVGNTFDYTMNTDDKTIVYTQGNVQGQAKYTFSDDKQQLTLEESNGDGGTRTTIFEKVSDNGDAEPSATADTGGEKEKDSGQ